MLVENTGFSSHLFILGAGFHQTTNGKFQFIRLVDTVQNGQAGLGIEIDQQDALAGFGQAGCKIVGGCTFAHIM